MGRWWVSSPSSNSNMLFNSGEPNSWGQSKLECKHPACWFNSRKALYPMFWLHFVINRVQIFLSWEPFLLLHLNLNSWMGMFHCLNLSLKDNPANSLDLKETKFHCQILEGRYVCADTSDHSLNLLGTKYNIPDFLKEKSKPGHKIVPVE